MQPHHTFCYVLIVLFLCSCRKVIELDLKESDIKYVIEAVITNEAGACKVALSKTRPFYQDNQFEGVSGAIVRIRDNGAEALLRETRQGLYETSAINGTPGHVYQLTVHIDNQEFTGTCTMPQPVPLTGLYVSPGPLGQFTFATVEYKDPPGSTNHYRFVQYLNGTEDPAIFWGNDAFTDGQAISTRLDTGVDKQDDPRNIRSGDTVTIEMRCLDKAVYTYWYSLRSGGGQGSANVAAPANPVTNISGGALGYFSAHTVSRRTVIAP